MSGVTPPARCAPLKKMPWIVPRSARDPARESPCRARPGAGLASAEQEARHQRAT